MEAAAAPAPRPGRRPCGRGARKAPIQSIDVRGNQRIEADTVRSYMLLQPGDPFDADRLDRSLKSLFATGLFKDVQVRREGSRVVVEVPENPIVNRVAFEGNRKISDDVLRGEVQMRSRAVFTPQAVQADRQRIQELYARRGRFAASVEPKLIQQDQNRVDVVYEIQEGDAALVGAHQLRRQQRIQRQQAARDRRQPRSRPGTGSSPPPTSSTPSACPSTASCCAASTCATAMPMCRSATRRPSWRPTAAASSSPIRSTKAPRYRVGKVDVVSNLRNLDAASVAPAGRYRARRLV